MSGAVLDLVRVDEPWVHQTYTRGETVPLGRGLPFAALSKPQILSRTSIHGFLQFSGASVFRGPGWWRESGISPAASITVSAPTPIHQIDKIEENLHKLEGLVSSIERLLPRDTRQVSVEVADLTRIRSDAKEMQLLLTSTVQQMMLVLQPAMVPQSLLQSLQQVEHALQVIVDATSQLMARGLPPDAQQQPTPITEVPPLETPDHLAMLDGLRQWLDLTYEDLEKITGIAKNTFHHWRREKATPRPSTVRRLLRVYALAHALVERLGVERAVEWFRTGPRSPLDLLLAGDVEAAENAAHVLLYRDLPRHLHDRIDYSPFTLEPDFEVRIALNPKPLQRATRHPKRGRLPSP